jgi:hypothetical protein
MTFRKSILLLMSLSIIAALLGCGSSSHHTTPPPPPPPGSAPLPDGTYVFSLSGTDSNNYSPYYVSGAFTVSGGAISGGEQDFTDFVSSDLNDGINPTGSSLSTTADGNLQITLVTCTGACPSGPDPAIGVGGNGTETINGTVLPLSSTSRTFINEFDAWASGSGELDTQSSVAALSGGYAFVLGGWDFNDNPLAVGGILDVSAGSILPAGSIFDLSDPGAAPPALVQGGALTGASSVTATPDTFGRVTFSLVTANSTGVNNLTVVGYTVDGNRIVLLEGFGDSLGGTEGGVALSQSAGSVTTGGFTAANAAGTYVIGLNGFDTSFDVLQVVNQLTLTAGAGVTGFVDFNDLVTSSLATSPDPVTAAAYTVDAAGAGDVTVSGITDGSVTYSLHLYLDGNGHALAISTDANDALASVAGFVQGAGPYAFSGAYGVDVTGWDFNYNGEFDGVGPVTATSGGTLSGDLDLNWLNLQVAPLEVADNSLTGTYVTTGTGAANGIFAGGSITGIDMTNCPAFTPGAPGCTADAFSYYLIDATGDNIAIETDLNQATLGLFAQQ